MPAHFNEETVEKLAVQWLGELGYGNADVAALCLTAYTGESKRWRNFATRCRLSC